jgi:hypothetical protein
MRDFSFLIVAIVKQFADSIQNKYFERLVGGQFAEAMKVSANRTNNLKVQILSRYQRIAFGQLPLTSYEKNALEAVAKALSNRSAFNDLIGIIDVCLEAEIRIEEILNTIHLPAIYQPSVLDQYSDALSSKLIKNISF